MSKYSFEFKLKIVQEYLGGKGGIQALANKHGVKAMEQVHRWINAYQEFGEEGLLRKRQNQNYSVQFKLNAIELYQTSELSYREVANILEMNNPILIANWMRKFRKEGKTKKHLMKETLEEQNRIKELEKQVRILQIENAFLKELRKLRKQEAQQRRVNQSRESSQVSEDSSN
ncbi:transcriptional regulator [Enterococcus termitis]|uniref:Transcriptional regulator n=1 Tax=Enterococcus termitis TaxID=332950 RepID=A0A1E5H0X6_9ENTE|nr:transcriptional regulator [Enterococcus termitis]